MATILVVDDDEQLRTFARRLLEGAGYTALEAADGVQGLRIYEEHKPDLVLTDIFMPHQDGLGMIRELKKRFGNVKIISLSAGSALLKGDFLSMAKTMGAAAVLSKPFEANQLLKVVKTVLDASPEE